MRNIELSKSCRTLLASIDVGGEQSRQFSEEIKLLKGLLKNAKTIEKDKSRMLSALNIARDFIISLPYINGEVQAQANEALDYIEPILTKAKTIS